MISVSLKLEHYKRLRIISYFGYLSLIIYLVHIFPLTASRVILVNYLHLSNAYVIIILQMSIAILFCVAFYKATEKLRIKKFLFGR